jgi:hypothetical protein
VRFIQAAQELLAQIQMAQVVVELELQEMEWLLQDSMAAMGVLVAVAAVVLEQVELKAQVAQESFIFSIRSRS